jgi:hypothetical protein
MQLLWIHYQGKKTNRFILLLELGRHQGKIHGLDSKGITDAIRQKIIDAQSILSALSLGERVVWLKRHCPAALRAYKAIHEENAKIVETHQLKS